MLNSLQHEMAHLLMWFMELGDAHMHQPSLTMELSETTERKRQFVI